MYGRGIPIVKDFDFVANLDDDRHCLQAAYAMAVHALSGNPITMAQAEADTGFAPGHSTWPFAAMLSLIRRGYMVRSVERFGIDDFVADPDAAIREQVGDDEIADRIAETSDYDLEVLRVKELVDSGGMSFEQRSPAFADIAESLRNGEVVIVNVNGLALNGKSGYVGHFILVTGVDDEFVEFVDPGLPPCPQGRASVDTFLKAWHYPTADVANMISVSG